MTATIAVAHHGQPLTKTFTAAGVVPYPNVAHFDFMEVEFDSFDTMVLTLEGIEEIPHACLLRGSPVREGPNQRRLLHDDPVKGAKTIVEATRQWVMLDFDKLPAPSTDMTMAERLDHLVDALPTVFHDVSFFYQWSSSAGMDGWQTLSAHLWFWLETPIACANLHKRSLRGDWEGVVDPAPFTPNQVIYTARPIFDGVADPLAGARSGVVRKSRDDAPVTRWVEPYKPAPLIPARVANRLGGGSHVEARLNEIETSIHCHAPVRAAIAAYVKLTPVLDRDRDWLIGEVANRCIGNGRSYMTREYFRRLYDGAVTKYG